MMRVIPTPLISALITLSVMMILPSLAESTPAKTTVKSSAEGMKEIGGNFTLTDHNGNSFKLEDQQGKLVLMFFGYTACPDICPTELASVARLLSTLKSEADKVAPLFVSVDPERDTVEKLKDYVPYYSKHLTGLTGTREEVDKVAEAYHVQYRIHPHKPSEKYYMVDHSANLYVINGKGKLSKIIPFGLPFEHMQKIVYEELALLK